MQPYRESSPQNNTNINQTPTGVVTRNPQVPTASPLSGTATNVQGNTTSQATNLQGFLTKGSPGTTVTLPKGTSPQTIMATEVDTSTAPATPVSTYVAISVIVLIVCGFLYLTYIRFTKQ